MIATLEQMLSETERKLYIVGAIREEERDCGSMWKVEFVIYSSLGWPGHGYRHKLGRIGYTAVLPDPFSERTSMPGSYKPITVSFPDHEEVEATYQRLIRGWGGEFKPFMVQLQFSMATDDLPMDNCEVWDWFCRIKEALRYYASAADSDQRWLIAQVLKRFYAFQSQLSEAESARRIRPSIRH